MQACSTIFPLLHGKQYLQAPMLSSWLRMQLCCPGTSGEGQLGAAPQGPCPLNRSRTWPVRDPYLNASQMTGRCHFMGAIPADSVQ